MTNQNADIIQAETRETIPDDELLIASVTPQNLERDVLWFAEHRGQLKRAAMVHPWWRDNIAVIEKDLRIKPSELARRLLDIGYERAERISGKGLFALRGGLIEVWPINTQKPFVIEFLGNSICAIYERRDAEEKIAPQAPSQDLLANLLPGNFLVHQDHGIGIFRGIITALSGIPQKFFAVEYAPSAPGREPDRLLVPVEQKERLTPYIGFETPSIHRLGGTVWITTKRKAREDAEKLARELLKLYEERSKTTRDPYPEDNALERELRLSFPFQETEDQLKAEEDIMRDLAKTKPMDRIICGDVGFGKTELAIRAALRVITSGRQVAVLCPTTVLAAQHARTFAERFGNLPVQVRMLSRMQITKDERHILKEISEGTADCIIGTHRLLSKDIAFRNLGLLIIDEEQRFGVKQKEKLKNMRAAIDVMSLSATPIPRTMQLSMANLWDISHLTTPPPERLPVKTFVLPYRKAVIKEAMERELARGGQVYFLHNRIETMDITTAKLTKLFSSKNPPRISMLHGRMKEREIMRVMEDFRAKKIDILVATTIIENGLDISSANTLVVDDATRLGLADAHQLRGRIGRSDAQAYAYFLYRPRNLTEKAAERLDTLQMYAHLGSGYQIALRDLEIRGAGNILGREQSGTINKVGLNLYCQMLAESVEKIRDALYT